MPSIPGQFPMTIVNDYFKELQEHINEMEDDLDKAFDHGLGRVLQRFDSSTNRLDKLGEDIRQIRKDWKDPEIVVSQEDLKKLDRALESKFVEVFGDDASSDLEDLLNNLRENHQISEGDAEDLASDIAKKTRNTSVRQVDKQVEKMSGIKPFQSMPDMSNKMGVHVQENVRLIKSIPEKYHDEVERVVREGALEGQSTQEIREKVYSAGRGTTNNAKLIARDQVGKFFGQATKERHQQLGFEKFKWRTVGDDRVRDEHEPLNGEVFTWKDGADGLFPGMDIQCRCIALPTNEDVSREFGTNEVDFDEPAQIKNPRKSMKRVSKTPEELNRESVEMGNMIRHGENVGERSEDLIQNYLNKSDRFAKGIYESRERQFNMVYGNTMSAKTNFTLNEIEDLVNQNGFEELVQIAKNNNVWGEIRGEIAEGNKAFIRDVIEKWNMTSGDSDEQALYIQLMAEDEFNINNSLKAHLPDDLLERAVREYGDQEDMYKSTLRAIYDKTQDHLASEGIDSMTIYRGMSFKEKNLPKEFASLDFNGMTKTTKEAGLQPLSSFAADIDETSYFATRGENKMVMASEVPADRIVSLGNTGLGTNREAEVVVAGGIDEYEVFPFLHEDDFWETNFFNVFGK